MIRALALVALVGCGGRNAPEETGFLDGMTFADVAPVFEARCSPCHVGTSTPSAGLRLDHASFIVEVAHEATGLDLVHPGSTDESYLWHKLVDTHQALAGGTGAAMPPVGELPAAELEIIRSWILGGALGDTGTAPTLSLCEDAPAGCEVGCAPGPGSVSHADWHNRLTESPEITWEPVAGAVAYEVALGSAPHDDDASCWTDVGAATTTTFRAIWVLAADTTYYASARAVFADGSRSEPTASAGWTVDIAPPAVPTGLDDGRASVDGTASWAHPRTDLGAGFDGFEVAVGTAPGASDALPWTDVGDTLDAQLQTELAGLPESAWYWLSVRSRDNADNRSQPATSVGFITCPPNFAFVPSDDDLGSTPFCVAVYEMRIAGNDDGNAPFEPTFTAESRASGTPWASIDKGGARVACDAMGFSYQLINNQQWQAVARSIERTDNNWSGGTVGAGAIPRGHSDESPLMALSSDGDPCVGTGNSGCEDPASADFSQRRTHALHNGEIVWDLAGNLTEQVDGSTGGPVGLWMSYDGAAFTTEPGWQDYRAAFAPLGDYTEVQGMGRMYGGNGNLSRGGAFDASGVGVGGSAGTADTGVFQAHHNTWNTSVTNGFRCVYIPM